MTKNRFAAFFVGAALAACAAGCTTTDTTTTTSNTATTTNNANTSGTMNTNGALNGNVSSTTTTTTTKTYNANITREDYDKNKEQYGREARESGRKIGTGAEDAWLWTKTKYSLAAAPDLRDSTINVDVENGVVTLSGTVANSGQRAKAAQIAKEVKGVSSVKDELKVSANDSVTNTSVTNTNATKNANR
jgi:osmotically-inducible protein OsmY